MPDGCGIDHWNEAIELAELPGAQTLPDENCRQVGVHLISIKPSSTILRTNRHKRGFLGVRQDSRDLIIQESPAPQLKYQNGPEGL